MKRLFKFFASKEGRITRIVAGVILILIGFSTAPILVVIGLVPLLAGIFDYCVFSPLAGFPFKGDLLRKAVNK